MLPPRPVLVAAKRWLELLPSSGGVSRAQALLTTHTEYDDLTPTQYATALTWLRDLGLLEDLSSQLPSANQILSAIFERAAPPWMQDADQLVQSPEELPPDIVSAGEALGIGANEVYEQLVLSWNKVNTAARKQVGQAGETALAALLRNIPGAQVDHVADWSDGFGYDIAFTNGNEACHFEVKSTTRANRFTAYLSRHEYSVMLRDDRWVLVTVRLTADLEVAGVGSVPREWIAANTPSDEGLFGSWASVKLEIPTEAIVSGIPHLGEHVADLLPAW